jgi:DNA gyrase/topoisomerase IV subunit A
VPRAVQPPSEEEQARHRLEVLDAYLLAAEHRAEVMEAVAVARDRDEAGESVARLLGITADQAARVLERRVVLFTQSDVAEARAEYDDIRGRLEREP